MTKPTLLLAPDPAVRPLRASESITLNHLRGDGPMDEIAEKKAKRRDALLTVKRLTEEIAALEVHMLIEGRVPE